MCVSIKYVFCAEPKGPSAMVVIYVADVQCVFCMSVLITIDHNPFFVVQSNVFFSKLTNFFYTIA